MRALHLLLVVALEACLTSKAMGRNELVCYQCQGHSLSECSQPKYLKACPNDQAYDRCETVLEKRGPGANLTVTKKCSLAPCVLDNAAARALTSSCDESRAQFLCSSCCAENACNSASKMKKQIGVAAVVVVVVAAATAASSF